MKDNFSLLSKEYAKFRPGYPKDLLTEIINLVETRERAWDCGTGNGQIAVILSDYFKEVIATDISENQINNAPKKSNITYKIESAEYPSIESNSLDLVVIAQAIHWFNFDLFYSHVKRVLKKDGVVAVIGYPLPVINAQMDGIINPFYSNVLNGYWDPERKYIDEEYKTISFPFKEISISNHKMKYRWTIEELLGYIGTWSAVQHYQKKNGKNPVSLIETELEKSWGDNTMIEVRFKLLTRIGINTGY